MSLVSLVPLLEDAQKNHYAVGAFSYCNAETAQASAEKGSELRAPVIYITGPWEIELLGVKMLANIAKTVAEDVDIPICLHLDHATEIDLVRECIDAGFPSVMMDASSYDFEENIRLTKLVVEMAHAKGVSVEGELGAVGRVDCFSVEGSENNALTDPAQAVEFVERTGIDALAVAIGNAHGMYPQRPELDLERLQQIRNATGVPLVLHGGSGTPEDQLRKAIEIGVTKVNVASELAKAYINAILNTDINNTWYSNALRNSKAAVAEAAGRWMKVLGCAGRIA